MKRQSGFTLFELLIVLSIIGILATVVATSYTSYPDDQKLEGAAGELVSALRYAQSEAVRTGAKKEVYIDTAAERFDVATVNSDNTLTTITHPVDKNKYIVDFTSSAYKGVDIVYVSWQPVYKANGRLNGGDLYIALSLSGKSKRVSIDSLTGRVSVE